MEAINSKNYPFVSIVVATYNGEIYIVDCIESLMSQSYPPERREIIVIIDPKTSDHTEEILSKYPITIMIGAQGGPASCRNEGVERANGEIIAFIDDDSTADKNWLEKLIMNYSNPEIGGVGGKPVDPKQGAFHEYNQIVSGLSGFEKQTKKVDVTKESYRTLPTSNVSYLKDVFVKIGGFDTKFKRAASEDRDLLWRILKKGYRLIYDPTAISYHYGDPSTFRTLVRKTYVMGQERVLFYRKHPDFFKYVKGHKTVKRTLVQFFSIFIIFTIIFIFLPTQYIALIICLGYVGLTIRYWLMRPEGGIKHAIIFPLMKLVTYIAWNLGIIKGRLRHGKDDNIDYKNNKSPQ